jgi:hypothetical protein
MADRGTHEAAPGQRIRRIDVAGRLQETALVVGRNGGQEGAVGDDLLEDRGRGAETGEELGVWCGHGKKVTGCPPQPIPL